MRLYPKANENRISGADPSVRPSRWNFLRDAGIHFVILQVLFLCLFSYLFGSLFTQESHVSNLNIIFVDYDRGFIGNSVRDAYMTLQGDGFPTMIEQPVADFSTPSDLEVAVCHIHYWAALYILPGASSRLQDALSGGSTYNNSDLLGYIWNEARYPTTSDSLILQNIHTLLYTARDIFVANNTFSANSSTAVSAFVSPWIPASLNIMPTSQGSRLIYNTLVIILILIQEFFYLGTINGLYLRYELFSRLRPRRIILYRIAISTAYTLTGSLCTTGAIWAFRAGWEVSGKQFALTWATLWLFAHANFLTLDVFAVWLPVPYVPMSLISWVVLNISSILIPFELMPGFYRWSYSMPANAVYNILINIWSGGCNPTLRFALPILFSLELLSLFLSSLGVYRRCHNAGVAGEAQQLAFRERLDAALRLEREREKEDRNETLTTEANTSRNNGELARRQTDKERGERHLSEAICAEDESLRRELRQSVQSEQLGPCFGVTFSNSKA